MALTTTLEIVHNGRALEIRALVAGGDWQIWVCDSGRRVYLHSLVPFDNEEEKEAVGVALSQAKRDIESDAIIIPVVRTWPPS